MKHVKLSGFFLLMLAFALLLSGCAAPEKAEKTTITIGMWPDPTQADDVAMFTKWKEAFEKDHPEYEITPQPYTYSPETVAAKGNSGTLPTVFQTYFTEPEALITQGFIRDITAQAEALGWADKMDPAMRETLSREGKLYGIPRDGYGLGLFLNLALLHDMDVIKKDTDGQYILHDGEMKPHYPTTLEEVRELALKAQEIYGGDVYGLCVLAANKTGGWQLNNLGWNFGAGALQTKDENGKWQAALNDPGMVKALEWVQEMARDELVYPSSSLNYNDWYQLIGSGSVLMAFCGSDAVAMPVTSYGFSKDDIAFVPMPTGDGSSRYALFGGTPFVFAQNASDKQVEGGLLFLKYIGRSPETDAVSLGAITEGYEVAKSKGMPVFPAVSPWVNEDFVREYQGITQQYINVNLAYYQDFFDTINTMKRDEEPHFTQEMYGLLDNAIQAVLANPFNANAESLLTTADAQFEATYLSRLNTGLE